ncbi:MAG: hypothetical protein GY836_10975, partial [Herbaspirillum sp.]|uniref:hypothetical protein n=1 Tax=Herbaspirillum sp. TaxID=1890675 RepID=UPI00258B64A0
MSRGTVVHVVFGVLFGLFRVLGSLLGIVPVSGGVVCGRPVVSGVVTAVVIDGDSSMVVSGLIEIVIVILLVISGVVTWGVGESVLTTSVGGQVVEGNIILHLSAKEDLGKSETDGVTEFIEVLVLPLGLSIHDLVVHILSVDDKIVLNVEDEVPGVSESLGHLSKLVEVSADGGLALFELVGDVVEDVTEILNTVKNGVEGGVLELIDDTTEALPDVLGITEALNTVRNLSLNGASEHTLEDLAHAEESEVDVGGFHGLEVVHLLILLVINLIQKLLPMVIEIEEELLVVDHLGLSVKKHGGGLTEVLTSINPFAHAVVMETLTGVLEHVHTVDDERLVGLEQDLLGMKEGLGHSLDLFIIVMIDLTAMVEHVTDVGDRETELVNGLSGLLVGSVPEAAHGVLEMLLDGVGVRHAVGNIGHTVEIESTDEETLDETANFDVVVHIVGLGDSDNKRSSERLEHSLKFLVYYYKISISIYLHYFKIYSL